MRTCSGGPSSEKEQDARTNSAWAFRVLRRLLEARKQCRVDFHQVPHFSGLGTQEMWAGLAEVQACVFVPWLFH